jgi:hypothetical protein
VEENVKNQQVTRKQKSNISKIKGYRLIILGDTTELQAKSSNTVFFSASDQKRIARGLDKVIRRMLTAHPASTLEALKIMSAPYGD